MRINSISNTNFTSRFCDRYNRPDYRTVETIDTQRRAKVYNQEDKEFANALEYLLNDGRDDIYEIRERNPQRTRNSGLDLYRNGKVVKSFENYDSSYYNWRRSIPALISEYAGETFNADLSKRTPAGKQWKNYFNVIDYIKNYHNKIEIIADDKKQYDDLLSSAYGISDILDKLETQELREKFDVLKNGVSDTRSEMQKELDKMSNQLDTIEKELNEFDPKKAAKDKKQEEPIQPENTPERKTTWGKRLESIQELREFLEDNKPRYKKNSQTRNSERRFLQVKIRIYD